MSRLRLNYAEYIWLDGATPTQELRSKTRILSHQEDRGVSSFPEWSFDGSSTWQALGRNSDCLLKPVFVVSDPIRGEDHYLVLCEVLSADGESHPTNKRAALVDIADKTRDEKAYIGFEQEYTLFTEENSSGKWPLGWPKGGFPAPQGPFYCGVGAGRVYGRDVVEAHTMACEEAELSIYGINAEVMPAQWEFQIGYRGTDEPADPLTMSDHMWVARYLLQRIAEDFDVVVSFDNKPIEGNWNGAGMHTNFSTLKTRDPKVGMESIDDAIKKLADKHLEHVANYGYGLDQRLTGLHETCHIGEFKSGVSNRGASIRIPVSTHQNGYGYLEDRRPGANADPYVVSRQLLEAICLS